MGHLDQLSWEIHATAVEKGFWDVEPVTVDFMLSKLALLHSEVSETLEAIRKQKGSAKIIEECADILIRLLDFVVALRIDADMVDLTVSFDDIVAEKMAINANRPRMHGNLA